MKLIDGGNQPQMSVNINVLELENHKCSECNNVLFQPCVTFKKVSALYTQTGKEELMPIDVFVCSNCGVPMKEYIPLLSKQGGNSDANV